MEDKITELVSGKVNREFINKLDSCDYWRTANRNILKRLAKIDYTLPSKNSEYNRTGIVKARLRNKLMKRNTNE